VRIRGTKPLRTADILILVLGLAFAWELARHDSFSTVTLWFAVALSLLALLAHILRLPATVQHFRTRRHLRG